ncbi:MAG: calcium/sodium antiporter [Gemmatimonadetes bacterium]|nr:calcium/sodium antiporter [Gemmatimonadota bacterium]
MTLPWAIGLVLGGLALLALGGDVLVRGATTIARLAGLTPAVIGLTVVALGTSLPELVVSVIASIDNQPDLAVGNVVGSNIFNITFIAGLSALVATLPIRGNVVRLEWPVMFLATLAMIVASRDGLIDRFEAAVGIVALAAFLAYSVYLARREVSALEQAELTDEVERLAIRVRGVQLTLALGAIAAGIGLLVVGGKVLVDGAVRLAQLAGMTERVIGLTIVAAGTSAPEVATSVMAALRKESDIAVANLIGSNIFNLLGILGVAGVILPLTVSPGMLASDVWWMAATALLLFLVMISRKALSRIEGAILLTAYGVYLYGLL